MSKAALKNGKRSMEEFRSLHDKAFIVPKKIRDGLERLGSDGWDYEVGFIKLAGLSTTDLANYRDEFADFVVNVGGKSPRRVWAGSKQLATKLRLMV